MSELQDFIIANGVLQRYRGNSMDVVIPDGVHTIEMLAFSRESKAIIENIQFPRTLERIEEWAFDHCDNLTGIVIPANVKEIGRGAFNWCRALSKVIIEGNPKIGDGAFRWSPWEENEFKKTGAQINGNTLLRVHPELTEYTIPSNIKIIGRDAFKNCKIKEVIVPHGVTKLDICAFAYSSIERISLPDTLKIVEAHAFSNCINLTELIIPKSVTRIGDCAFEELPNCVLTILNECDDEEVFRVASDSFGRRTPHIKEIRVPYGSAAMRYAMECGLNVTTFPCSPAKFGNPKRYHYIDDMFCCEGATLHEYFGHQETIHIPDGISVIGDNAFTNADVKKVYLPKSVKRIEKFGFASCDNLMEVSGEGVLAIDWHSFYDCANLQRVSFPKLERCYDISFENCDNLRRENIFIPDDAKVIEVQITPCGCGHIHKKRTPFT